MHGLTAQIVIGQQPQALDDVVRPELPELRITNSVEELEGALVPGVPA